MLWVETGGSYLYDVTGFVRHITRGFIRFEGVCTMLQDSGDSNGLIRCNSCTMALGPDRNHTMRWAKPCELLELGAENI